MTPDSGQIVAGTGTNVKKHQATLTPNGGLASALAMVKQLSHKYFGADITK
ncbi:hypothetical protein [Limosilactobacillus antri]|uniref:hypothetical protein n=1 Tax=Limosilactobacillus antri TaxID=227943 RepID=UPI001F55C22E|nr:hypothetical protein [Limosilactobacillus antri]